MNGMQKSCKNFLPLIAAGIQESRLAGSKLSTMVATEALSSSQQVPKNNAKMVLAKIER
jgi:hypothetical protein